MWKLIFVALAALATAEKVKYDNYKVFRVTPQTEEQVEVIRNLEEISDGFSFWKEPNTVQNTADVMVAPHKIPDFQDIMEKFDILYDTYVSDVQSLIDTELPAVIQPLVSFDLTRYHTLDEIYAFLDSLAKENPGKVQVIVGGKTHEGRQIKGVKLTLGNSKSGIVLEGGIHAREWISPASALYIANELIHSKNADVRQLAESHEWHIFPVVNPDGYVYTHTKNRLWRKTRKPYGLCYGSDPNRNWGYKWMSGGASNNPCSETYAGSSAFSDVETKSLSEYLTSISSKFTAYVSFHSYSQLLMFPYGHTTQHLDNYNDELQIANKAIQALAKRYGTKYTAGNVAETIYIASGSSVDWVKGTFHKPVTYTYELRDTGRHGFLLPADQIAPTALETLDSLVAMFKEAKARGYE